MNSIHQRSSKPIKSLSQSLGSLLIYWANHTQKIRFHQHTFLAPALEVKWLFSLHKALFFFSDKFEVPSKNLAEYSSYPFTSLGEYRSVDILLKEVHSFSNISLPNLSVFLNPKDELVHYKDSKIHFHKLNANIQIAKKNDSAIGAEHLFVDRKTAGEGLYKRILTSLE